MIQKIPSLARMEEELLAEAKGLTFRWCGRGTTALIWAFKAAALSRPDIDNPEVILQATACSTMPAAAILAGCTPRFVDVRIEDALPSAADILATITEKTVAVLYIHMYGNTDNLADLHRALRSRGIWLIEDGAQALGGRLPEGSLVGTTGDAIIYGFNSNKILESGGGGLMVRDNKFEGWVQEAVRVSPSIPPYDRQRAAKFEGSYQGIYAGLVEIERLDISHRPDEIFRQVLQFYRESFYRYDLPKAMLGKEWSQLEENLAHRREMAAIYQAGLPPEVGTSINHFEQSGVCWFFTILTVPSIAPDTLIGALRRKGFMASDLYWPLDTLFSPQPHCANSLEIGRRVVNLPVDKKVNGRVVEEMLKVMKGLV